MIVIVGAPAEVRRRGAAAGRNRQADCAQPGVLRPVPVAVATVRPSRGTPIPLGPNLRGDVDLDQLLETRLEGVVKTRGLIDPRLAQEIPACDTIGPHPVRLPSEVSANA